jgi:hypothetical protein
MSEKKLTMPKMPKLDMDAIKQAQEEATKGSDGASNFFAQKDIPQSSDGEGLYVKLLPPMAASMHGQPSYKEVGVWCNKKRLISQETFGEACAMMDYLKVIKDRTKKEPALKTLWDDWNTFSIKPIFYFPCLVLDIAFKGNTTKIASIKVQDDEIKVFQCSKTLAAEILGFTRNRMYNTEDGLSLMSPTDGRAIVMTKTGTKQDTKYQLLVSPFNVDTSTEVKHYQPDVYPDIPAMVTEKFKGDEYNVGILKEYFEGITYVPAEGDDEASGGIAGDMAD